MAGGWPPGEPARPADPAGASTVDPVPTTDYGFLDAALTDRDAGAFVHVGGRRDPDLRYLTRLDGTDQSCAFVFTDGEAVCCVPRRHVERARRTFPGDAVYGPDDVDGATPGERAAAVLADRDAAGIVLAPSHLPHDAALRVEGAGFDLASTTAVADARAVKTDAEVERHRAVQSASRAGVARVAELLATATTDGDVLQLDGATLTTGRLRREANAALAAAGVEPAGNSVVAASSRDAAADGAAGDGRGDAPVHPGAPVVVALAPRGPAGYHGRLVRTFVVAGEGGWERRAHVAADRALDAGLATAAAGVPARKVHTEVGAEVAAYGFAADPDAESGFTGEAGHGVGLARREAPSLTADADLQAGNVLAVEAGVADPGRGAVRLADLVVVTDDGCEVLADHPRSLVPVDRTAE